jgi:hypothetical protein
MVITNVIGCNHTNNEQRQKTLRSKEELKKQDLLYAQSKKDKTGKW